jgi:hypothetical protein
MAGAKKIDLARLDVGAALEGTTITPTMDPVVGKPETKFEPPSTPKKTDFGAFETAYSKGLTKNSLLWQTLGHPDGYKVGELPPPKEMEYPTEQEMADLNDEGLLAEQMFLVRKRSRRG